MRGAKRGASHLETPTGGGHSFLKLQSPFPEQPFINQWNTVQLCLADGQEDGASIRLNQQVPITVEVVFVNNMNPEVIAANGGVLEEDYTLVPDQQLWFVLKEKLPLTIPATGLLKFNIKFLLCSGTEPASKSLALRLSSPGGKVQEVMSGHFQVIRHRLKLVGNGPPDVWFKDEGGKVKSIRVEAQLVDHLDQVVSHRKMPLKPVLLYKTGEQVKNHDILKLTDSVAIVNDSGKVDIKCRIEEVSKNHQKQAFRIHLVPDYAVEGASEIAGLITGPIHVKSKRNKRAGKGDTASEKDSFTLSLGTGQAVSSARLTKKEPYPPTFFSTAGRVSARLGSGKKESGQGSAGTRGGGGMSDSDDGDDGMDSAMGSVPTAAPHPPVSSANTNNNSGGSGNTNAAAARGNFKKKKVGQEEQTVASVVDTVINWCWYVYTGLQVMEWQHVGFEVNDDQTANVQRPIYRCPGCWSYKDGVNASVHTPACLIYRSMHNYHTEVKGALQKLGEGCVIMPQSTSSSSSSSSSTHAQVAARGGDDDPATWFDDNSSSSHFAQLNKASSFTSRSEAHITREISCTAPMLPSILPGSFQSSFAGTGSSTSSLGGGTTNANGGNGDYLAHTASVDSGMHPFPSSLGGAQGNEWGQNAMGNASSSLLPLLTESVSNVSTSGLQLGSPRQSLAGAQQTGRWGGMTTGAHMMGEAQGSFTLKRGLSLSMGGPSLSLLNPGQSSGIGGMFGTGGGTSMWMQASYSNSYGIPAPSAGASANHTDEQKVHGVHVISTPLGVPCFSVSHVVLGYYQYDNETSCITFNSARNISDDLHDTNQLRADYIEAEGGDDVLTLAECRTLKNLREQAWSKVFESQARSQREYIRSLPDA